MMPHLQNALGFFTHTLPRPVLAALIFRLTILHFASRVVAQMTDDRWGDDDATVEGRPVRIPLVYMPYGLFMGSFNRARHLPLSS